jgi:hypothetical protein
MCRDSAEYKGNKISDKTTKVTQCACSRIRLGVKLTCPHLVMRGHTGGERQIGHVVRPSSREMVSPSVKADAMTDERGIMTCKMSCHWKEL